MLELQIGRTPLDDFAGDFALDSMAEDFTRWVTDDWYMSTKQKRTYTVSIDQQVQLCVLSFPRSIHAQQCPANHR